MHVFGYNMVPDRVFGQPKAAPILFLLPWEVSGMMCIYIYIYIYICNSYCMVNCALVYLLLEFPRVQSA